MLVDEGAGAAGQKPFGAPESSAAEEAKQAAGAQGGADVQMAGGVANASEN